MRKLLLLILVVLAAGVWVAGRMAQDSGYLLIAYGDTTVEMSLWVGLGFLVVSVALIYFGLWLLRKLWGGGDAARRWRHRLRYRRALAKTNAGVIRYLEGDWQGAQKKLDQAVATTDMPLLGVLAAARAAAKNQDYPAVESLLRRALQIEPSAKLAIELARIEVQIQRKQYEQALAALLQLRKAHPKQAYVCRLLQEVYVALEDWESLSQLLPVMRKLKVAPVTELEQIVRKTALFQLEKAANEKSESSLAGQAQRVVEVWNKLPQKVRRDEAITLAYTRYLKKLGKAELAEQALADSITVHWSEALVEQFGLICAEDPHRQLLTAERWLQERNNSSVLMLALGRLSLRNKLWGKAREYFVSSIKLKNTLEGSAELGRLLHHLGDEQGSRRYLQQSVELIQKNLPSLPMPDKPAAKAHIA